MAGRKRGRRAKGEPDPRDKIPEILKRIAEGESLRQVCATDGFPIASTFLAWVALDEELQAAYAVAMEQRADHHFEEIFDIADDASNDWMERKGDKGEGWELNGEHVQRSKLRIDARKWALARMNPKKYGDKVDLNHSGKVKVVSLNSEDEAI